MPGCNKVFYSVLGGCLAAGLWISIGVAQDSLQEKPERDRSDQGIAAGSEASNDAAQSKTRGDAANNAQSLPGAATPNQEESEEPCSPRCQAAEKRAIDDLAAQQSMAASTASMTETAWVQVGIGVAALVLLGFTVFFTWRTAQQTEGMLKEAGKTTKAAEATVALTKETAAQELRAYVSLGTKGLYSTDDRPKMQVTNFGNTPATKVYIWRDIVDKAPAEFVYSGGHFIARNIMIQPKQDMFFFWADSMREREYRLLYGYIEYDDIHGRRWRSRFAWHHIHDTLYVPLEEHNDEIEITEA
jgi:hypothetical protein